jgi:hypothetical protein
MNCFAVSSGFCLNRAKSSIETPTSDLAKWDWNFSSISSHEFMEFTGSEAYQVNACPVKELENNRYCPFPLWDDKS